MIGPRFVLDQHHFNTCDILKPLSLVEHTQSFQHINIGLNRASRHAEHAFLYIQATRISTIAWRSRRLRQQCFSPNSKVPGNLQHGCTHDSLQAQAPRLRNAIAPSSVPSAATSFLSSCWSQRQGRVHVEKCPCQPLSHHPLGSHTSWSPRTSHGSNKRF